MYRRAFKTAFLFCLQTLFAAALAEANTLTTLSGNKGTVQGAGTRLWKPGQKVCAYKKGRIVICGRVQRVMGKSAQVQFPSGRLLKKGLQVQAAHPQRQARKSSCQGRPKVSRIIRSRNWVELNQGTSCGISTGMPLCLYGNLRRQACGKVIIASPRKAFLQVPRRRLSALRRGYNAIPRSKSRQAFANKNSQAPSSGGTGGSSDFFSIDKEMASNLREAKAGVGNRPVYFGGYLKESLAYGYDPDVRQAKKMRTTLNLGLDLKFSDSLKGRFEVNGWYDYVYEYRGKEKYSPDTIEAYETDVDLRDGWLEYAITPASSLKFGRQIIAWGESDFSQVADIPNPRDQLEIGLVDVEDARLAVTATKFSIIKKGFETDLVAVHEIRPNRIPTDGSDFDPFKPLRGAIEFGEEVVPESKPENTEFFLRLKKIFNGGQIALIGGSHYDDEAFLAVSDFESDGEVSNITANLEYRRIQTIGLAGNIISGDALFKTEIAGHLQKYIARGDIIEQINADPTGETVVLTEQRNTIETMIGLEYSGFSDIDIIVEGVNERILDHNPLFFQERDEGRINSLVSYETYDGDIEYNLSWTHLNRGNGEVYRATVDFEVTDNFETGIGIIDFDFDEELSVLKEYNTEDRVFLDVKWNF